MFQDYRNEFRFDFLSVRILLWQVDQACAKKQKAYYNHQ
jgi:hypothetical protein